MSDPSGARVEPDSLDGGWVAESLEMPGVLSQGKTKHEALANLAEALAEARAATSPQSIHFGLVVRWTVGPDDFTTDTVAIMQNVATSVRIAMHQAGVTADRDLWLCMTEARDRLDAFIHSEDAS